MGPIAVALLAELAAASVQPQAKPTGREKTAAQIARAALPAVVTITSRGPGGDSTGTGFIIHRSGTIITNLHVIQGATELAVKTSCGEIFDHVMVQAYDQKRDLAVIQYPRLRAPDDSARQLGPGPSRGWSRPHRQPSRPGRLRVERAGERHSHARHWDETSTDGCSGQRREQRRPTVQHEGRGHRRTRVQAARRGGAKLRRTDRLRTWAAWDAGAHDAGAAQRSHQGRPRRPERPRHLVAPGGPLDWKRDLDRIWHVLQHGRHPRASTSWIRRWPEATPPVLVGRAPSSGRSTGPRSPSPSRLRLPTVRACSLA